MMATAEADRILVVETKVDGDTSPLNAGKLTAALDHFSTINAMLEERGQDFRYQFHILSPDDYDSFFDALRRRALDHFVSGLQGALT